MDVNPLSMAALISGVRRRAFEESAALVETELLAIKHYTLAQKLPDLIRALIDKDQSE